MKKKNLEKVINSDSFELSEEQCDYLRKCFFKILNEVTIVCSEVYKVKINSQVEVKTMSKNEEIKIPVFDGQDYNIEKKTIAILKVEKM